MAFIEAHKELRHSYDIARVRCKRIPLGGAYACSKIYFLQQHLFAAHTNKTYSIILMRHSLFVISAPKIHAFYTCDLNSIIHSTVFKHLYSFLNFSAMQKKNLDAFIIFAPQNVSDTMLFQCLPEKCTDTTNLSFQS